MRALIILSFAFLMAAGTAGAESAPPAAVTANPLTFQAWKDQQVLEAQNQVLRLASRVSLFKSGKLTTNAGGIKQPARLPSDKVKFADTEALAGAEADLKRAQDSLANARDLKFSDYVDVYIPTLQNQPEAQQKLAEKLSKEELSEIFKGLMQKSSQYDAQHGEASLGDLTVTARAKAP
jgi:hypothetical protein